MTRQLTEQNKQELNIASGLTKSSFSKKADLMLRDLKKDRDAEVITSRYGLKNGDIKTLEAIGKKLNITRERVRQIEKSSLKRLEKSALDNNEVSKFFRELELGLEKTGGLASEEKLIRQFVPTKEQNIGEINAMVFLAVLDNKANRTGESKDFRSHWTSKKESQKKLTDLSKRIDLIFDENKKVLDAKEIAVLLDEDVKIVESVLWIKKNVMETDEGKWGLRTWREVNPKSIRDKTYLILRNHNKPLHYSDLADKISKHKLQKRPVTKQAVHNELIRDPRFILIGRGIYALAEWGYAPGVVEDVIKEILEEHGEPMHKNDIIKKVQEKRIVKETTIILNLQKNTFKRVARATYTLQQ